jgi:hypothetical protein
MSLALSKASIKMALSSTPCFGFTALKPVWQLRLIPFAVILGLTPRIMDKIQELKTELAVNEALAQQWTYLAKSAEKRNDTSTMLRRLGEANKYARLALDTQAQLNVWS